MFPQTVFRMEPHNWNYASVSAHRNIKDPYWCSRHPMQKSRGKRKNQKVEKAKRKGHILEPARTPRNTPVQYDT